MRDNALKFLLVSLMAQYVLSFQVRVGKHLFSDLIHTPRVPVRLSSRLFSVEKKRVVFLGTPEVAASSLKRLYEESKKEDTLYEIVAVITQPPRRRKRQGQLEPSPVGKVAEDLGIPVLHPEKVGFNCSIIHNRNESSASHGGSIDLCRQKIPHSWMIWRRMSNPIFVLRLPMGNIYQNDFLQPPHMALLIFTRVYCPDGAVLVPYSDLWRLATTQSV